LGLQNSLISSVNSKVCYPVSVISCSLINALFNILKQLKILVFENVSLYAWLNTFHIMFRGRNHNFSNRKCYLKGSRKAYISIDCLYPMNSCYYVDITCKSINNRYLLLLRSRLGHCCLARLGDMNIWKACQRCQTRALGGTFLMILWLSSVLPRNV